MAIRQNTFILKRSNIPGNVPVAGQIQLGELALNTADVILYASGTTCSCILPIGWDRVARTGDTMTGTLYGPEFSATTIYGTTISATTYLNLPLDILITGGTSNDATHLYTFTNNTGGTFTVLGLTDVFVTGGTFTNDNLYLTNNTGGTFNVYINNFSGLTVNGDISGYNISGTTLYGNGQYISVIGGSLQTVLDSKIPLPASPELGYYLFFNGVDWVANELIIPVSAGAGVTFFLEVSGGTVPPGYEFLSTIPSSLIEEADCATVNNNTVLISSYASEPLNRTVIDAGVWNFNTYTSVDSINLGTLTNIRSDVYSRTSGGVETFLFSVSTDNIITSGASIESIITIQPAFTILPSDILVVKYYASTTNTYNTQVCLYHGGALHYSNIETPFVTSHNDLVGLQGGSTNDYYHLTLNQLNFLAAEIAGTITGTTISGTSVYGTTISATTYLGLPLEIVVTGGTFNTTTRVATFTNNTGGTFTVGGFSDVYVTGATYNNANQFTYTNNSGGTFSVLFNTVTGLTVNGNLTVTGTTTSSIVSATTISAITVNHVTPFPIGELYMMGNTNATTNASTNTYYKVTGTTTTGTMVGFSSTVNGRLTYTGNTTLTFQVTANMTLFSAGSNKIARMAIVMNGAGAPVSSSGILANTAQQVNLITTSDSGYCGGIVTLAPNDYLEVYVRNTTSANNNITVDSLSFIVKQV
jgi:hypothetical protein